MISKLLTCISLMLLNFGVDVAAQNMTAEAILAKADKINTAYTAVYKMEMRLKRPGRSDKVYQMKISKKGNDKILGLFLAPSKVEGRAFLRNGDKMYLYEPTIGKIIPLSPKQMMAGGDFSNGDIMRLNLAEDYHAKLLGIEVMENDSCYVLELKAKNRSIAYDMIKYWIKKDNFFPLRQEFYTLSGKLLKILKYSEPKMMGGRVRPTVLIMTNTLKKKYKTILTFLEMKTNVKLSDYLFRKQYLERL